jgi:hypothetical protein
MLQNLKVSRRLYQVVAAASTLIRSIIAVKSRCAYARPVCVRAPRLPAKRRPSRRPRVAVPGYRSRVLYVVVVWQSTAQDMVFCVPFLRVRRKRRSRRIVFRLAFVLTISDGPPTARCLPLAREGLVTSPQGIFQPPAVRSATFMLHPC